MRNCRMNLDFLILVNCRNEEFGIKQDYAGLVDCLSCSLEMQQGFICCTRDLCAVPGIYGYKHRGFISINP